MEDSGQVSIRRNAVLTKTGVVDYWENMAIGLINYAGRSKIFAAILHELAVKINISSVANSESTQKPVSLFEPVDLTTATSRATWVVKCLEEELPGTVFARNRLARWAGDKSFELPHMVIIGIVGVAIPGITLGLIKRRMEMPIIIRAEAAQNLGLELSQRITQASHDVLKNALVLAGGDMKMIEPELADWFFGEKTLTCYTASREEMERMQTELVSSDLPHGNADLNGELTVLALSPSINLFNLRSDYNIEQY